VADINNVQKKSGLWEWALAGSSASALPTNGASFGIGNIVDRHLSTVRSTLTGMQGNDIVRAGSADDSLYGADGNDILYGGVGKNYLDGGNGDDMVFGGAGDDSYMFSAGNDIISDLSGKSDKLFLRGSVKMSDLSFAADGSDLVIADSRLGSTVRIVEHFGAGTIEQLRLADGTLLDMRDGFGARAGYEAQQAAAQATAHGAAAQAAAAVQAQLDFKTDATTHGWGGVDENLYRGSGGSASASAVAGSLKAGLAPTNPNDDHVVTVKLGTTAAQLNALIAGAQEGTTFLLQKGTYIFDKQIDIRHGDVTLKGAGEDQTVIVATGITRADAIRVQAPWQKESFGNIEGSEAKLNTTLKSGADEHATSVTLGSVAKLAVGDFLEISQKNLPSTADKSANFLGTLVEVTAIDAASGKVTLAHEIGVDASKGATVRGVELLHNVVLGDFTIDYGTPANAVDPYRYVNNNTQYVGEPGMEGMGVRAIFLNDVADSALYNVTIKNAGSNGVVVRSAVGLEVNGLTVDGVQNLGDGGNGYGLDIARSYYSTYENLKLEGLVRHGVTFSKDGSSAFNNVHVASSTANVDFHGGPDSKNIYYVEQMTLTQVKDDYAFNGVDYRDTRNEGQNTVIFDSFTGADAVQMAKTDPGYKPINYTGKDSASSLNSYSAARDDIIHTGGKSGTINTAAGNDTIYSGSGNQSIWTGAGKDTIVFGSNTGHDEIFDFDAKIDRIDIEARLNGTTFSSAKDVLAHAHSNGHGDVLLSLGGGHDVLLHGISLDQLNASNIHII
jgi:hypothetical protein